MDLLSRIQDLKVRLRNGSEYSSLPYLSRFFLIHNGHEDDLLASEEAGELQWVYYYAPQSESMGTCFKTLGASESVIALNIGGILDQSSFIMDLSPDPDPAELVAQLLAYVEVHELTHWAMGDDQDVAHMASQEHSRRWHSTLVEALEADLVEHMFRPYPGPIVTKIESTINVGESTNTN